jgi:hypothetical protein
LEDILMKKIIITTVSVFLIVSAEIKFVSTNVQNVIHRTLSSGFSVAYAGPGEEPGGGTGGEPSGGGSGSGGSGEKGRKRN